MQQVQVVPEKVYPNPGKKYAVIEQMNVRYLVPQQYGGMFQVGVATNLGIKQENWGKAGQAPDMKNIVVAVNGQNVTGQAGPVQGGDRPAPLPQNVPQTPAKTLDTAEDIFVTGIVGRAMGSGKFEAGDISGLAKCALRAWRNRGVEEVDDSSYGLNAPEGDPYG